MRIHSLVLCTPSLLLLGTAGMATIAGLATGCSTASNNAADAGADVHVPIGDATVLTHDAAFYRQDTGIDAGVDASQPTPACATGLTFCPQSSACVDLTTSAAYCGSCTQGCPFSQICSASKCTCPAGTTLNGAVCESPDAGHDAGHDSGVDGGACSSGTIYTRLGGHDGIRAAVNAVVTAELKNADIASYFFFQGGAPANGHPTSNQIEECFTDLVGFSISGTETYPTKVGADGGIATDGGALEFTCRTLATAHRALKIDKNTFNTFIAIAGTTLTTLNVCPADIATLAGALEASSTSIVTVDGGPPDAQAFPGSIDAASKLDATF